MRSADRPASHCRCLPTTGFIFPLSPIQNPVTAAPDCLSTDNPLIAVVGGTPDCSEMAKLSECN